MKTTAIVEHLDRIMRGVDAEMHRLAPAIDEARVGPLGSITLKRIAGLTPVPLHVLVDAMGRDPSQMSRVISSLERKGLVSKSAQSSDRRVSVLTLTPAGAAHVDKLDHLLRGVIDDLLRPLSEQERDLLLMLLAKVTASAV
ncbi:MAG: MarR family transcriptional regulator [Pseudomonadota bacterium]